MKKYVAFLFMTLAYFKVQAQWLTPNQLSDLNTWSSQPGFIGWYGTSVNTPTSLVYGSGIQTVLPSDPRFGTQLVIPTFDNQVYYRMVVAGTYGPWYTMWSSANLNNSSADFAARNIYTSGNVGIGTTTPLHTLEVSGSTGGRGTMGNGSTGQWYEIFPYEIGTDNNAGWTGTMIGVRSGGMNSSSTPITQNITANNGKYQQAWAMTFGTDKDQTNGSAFSIWTGDATNPGTAMSEIFRIKSNGNVGIGTADTKGYQLAVNGNAIATSMTVKLYSAWPDYVFKPAYHLPSLTEVKTYIDQNHHLPDMPSEQEVAKDGLNLGEMNKLLTKKVEELTLYLIEQAKNNQEQQKQIVIQNKKLKELEARLSKIETPKTTKP